MMVHPNANFYDVMRLPVDCSPADIRRAFRQLARQFHPDKNTGENKEAAERAFKRVSAAYDVLGDPLKRLRYDMELAGAARRREEEEERRRARRERWARWERERRSARRSASPRSARRSASPRRSPPRGFDRRRAASEEKGWCRTLENAKFWVTMFLVLCPLISAPLGLFMVVYFPVRGVLLEGWRGLSSVLREAKFWMTMFLVLCPFTSAPLFLFMFLFLMVRVLRRELQPLSAFLRPVFEADAPGRPP